MVFDFADDPDGMLSAVSDKGDGTYVAIVTAPERGADDEFRARVAGQPVGITAPIHYGFTLDEVIDAALVDIAVLLDRSDLLKKPRRLLEKSVVRLEEARALLLAGSAKEERRAIARVSKAARLVKRARKRSRNVPLPDISFELAEAARLRVSKILSGILFNPPNSKGEARIRKAKNKLAEGPEGRRTLPLGFPIRTPLPPQLGCRPGFRAIYC